MYVYSCTFLNTSGQNKLKSAKLLLKVVKITGFNISRQYNYIIYFFKFIVNKLTVNIQNMKYLFTLEMII